MNIALLIIQPIFFLALAPLFLGIVRTTKARLQNRRGASIFQPYWALATLCKKEMTIPEWSTWVFHTVPYMVLTTAVVLACIIPAFAVNPLLTSFDNVFLITGVLALGVVFLVFGGMDTGSTFGNMGSSREMILAAIIEPTLFLVFAVLGALYGSWSIGGILANASQFPLHAIAPTLLAALALAFAALLENARYPVDNPATHLELTMVHEAMVLEYSGPYLAMLEYASAIKLIVLSTLVLNIAMPVYVTVSGVALGAVAIALLIGMIKVVVAPCGLALIETLVVKMRFYRMQEYALLAFLVAVSSFIAALAIAFT